MKPNLKLTAFANMAVGAMVIYNQNNVKFSNNLLELLGIKNTFFITYVKRLTSPSTYFVHCDLIDKKQNLINGKPSTDLRGKPFEKVHYQTAQQHVLRDTSTGRQYLLKAKKTICLTSMANLWNLNSK